jgi:hypothetical protein
VWIGMTDELTRRARRHTLVVRDPAQTAAIPK